MSFGVLYKAATGMLSLSTGMQTVSNNLANVNTVGFKAMRTNYEDLISQCYYSGGNHNQIGLGVKVSTIQTVFNQGAFKATESDTDIAIAGDGFFNVRNPQTGEIRYTRAGVYTFRNDGYMEDPSHNILQGWQMSIPQPGQPAVRIGNPVDIQITQLKAPPVATTTVRSVSNLNAGDTPSYYYPANALADQIAKGVAGAQAASSASAASLATWNPPQSGGSGTDVPVEMLTSAQPSNLAASNNAEYNDLFIKNYNDTHAPASAVTALSDLTVVADGLEDPAAGKLSQAQFDALVFQTTSGMEKLAAQRGEDAYAQVYQNAYDLAYDAAEVSVGAGNEGMGFAGAWDPTEKPPMAVGTYSYSEPMTIYDENGREHTLMIYYQKNPHMENVWDYIVTCDPEEDARTDASGKLLFTDPNSFAGLLQKGKITFDADGHIKDIEAENLDLGGSRQASADAPTPSGTASSAMQTASIGGYFNASPTVDPATGKYVSSDRTYNITWGWQDPATGVWSENNNANPPTSGFTWTDDQGNSGFVIVDSKSYPGPYTFGSGLSVTFESNNSAMTFGAPGQDSIEFTAHSEQMGWTRAAANSNGHFDFTAAFTTSAVGSLNPPLAQNPATVTQTVGLDMGSKKTGAAWVNDGVSTTQYGGIKSGIISKDQNGYPESSLQRTYVRDDGMVVAVYDKKREMELYQICLTRFRNPNGLDKKGDNLFAATRESGEGIDLAPGEGGAGKTIGNFLEQSTVDTATEIVQMIMTQRGFQANSKSVTTKDTMLATAIELKR
ncbi:flagellar hook-basal body complex protein [Deltaproteobacteria bacterium OttesenSCG-928-M10]|nr:flagellar hook-basal body complex protein [Deltaproteobacteria bacterium OttesenSCG-928-M10]